MQTMEALLAHGLLILDHEPSYDHLSHVPKEPTHIEGIPLHYQEFLAKPLMLARVLPYSVQVPNKNLKQLNPFLYYI